MHSKASTVTAYLAAQQPNASAALSALRKLVRRTLPHATENMQFGMPSYWIGDRPVCALASQKNYLCMYLCQTDLVAKHKTAFKGLSIGKSCIRFRRLDQLPVDAVVSILLATKKRFTAPKKKAAAGAN